MNYREVIDEITKSIQESINRIKDGLHYDVTFKARIEEVLGNDRYKIRYRQRLYTVKSHIPCTTGDAVRVCAPCNDWNDLFVSAKIPGSRLPG